MHVGRLYRIHTIRHIRSTRQDTRVAKIKTTWQDMEIDDSIFRKRKNKAGEFCHNKRFLAEFVMTITNAS